MLGGGSVNSQYQGKAREKHYTPALAVTFPARRRGYAGTLIRNGSGSSIGSAAGMSVA